MKILALEFSSAQRSVAVAEAAAAGQPWRVAEVVEAGSLSSKPFALIDEALRQAGWEREQVECVAVGLGPGSYTGIRMGIAMAQGWQLAAGVKLLGISSAECVAAQAQAEGMTGRIAVVIDAQRGEFYLAGYDLTPTGCRELEPLRLVSGAEVKERAQGGERLVGPEAGAWVPGSRVIFPRAAALAGLAKTRADFISGERLEPIYLRETRFVKAPPPRQLA